MTKKSCTVVHCVSTHTHTHSVFALLLPAQLQLFGRAGGYLAYPTPTRRGKVLRSFRLCWCRSVRAPPVTSWTNPDLFSRIPPAELSRGWDYLPLPPCWASCLLPVSLMHFVSHPGSPTSTIHTRDSTPPLVEDLAEGFLF